MAIEASAAGGPGVLGGARGGPFDAAHEIRGGAWEALEEELRGVHALVAELGDGLHDLEPRRSLLDDEAGHALVAGLRLGVCQGEEREGVALAPVGHEHLGAGDEIAIAIAPGDGADGLDVGARVRLRQAKAAARPPGGPAPPGAAAPVP